MTVIVGNSSEKAEKHYIIASMENYLQIRAVSNHLDKLIKFCAYKRDSLWSISERDDMFTAI